MKVMVNGKPMDVGESVSLTDFIKTIRSDPEGLIAELNEKVINKEIWTETVLADGDQLELVSLVGGG